jgi:tRNA threonylcarbamoyladenosine biosynthesis protein TsaE
VTVHLTHSEEETQAIARGLAAELAAGDVVLLSGDLGAGKTAFVRGLAEGLGIDPDDVSSPTFALIHEYKGNPMTLYHADLYRLTTAEAGEIGLEEMGGGGVLAIEWPDRLAHDMPNAITIDMELAGETTRRIIVGRRQSAAGNRPRSRFAG